MNRKTLFSCLFNPLALSLMLFVLSLGVGASTMLPGSAGSRTGSLSLGPLQGYNPDDGDAMPAVKPRVNTNLTYHNGPVMAEVMNVYLIFWEPPGIQIDPNYNRLIGRYYNDVGGSGLYNINQQYTATNGAPVTAVIRGVWLDNTRADAYPRGTFLSPYAIALEVQRAMIVNGWSPGISNFFPVYTSPGAGTTTPFCAYHNFFAVSTPPVPGHVAVPGISPVVFAHIVYPTGYYARCQIRLRNWVSPNNCVVCDSAISISAHEQFEAATDPLGTGWFYLTTAGEIGDLCQLNYGRLTFDNGKANQDWNNDFYIVQMMWDNAQSGCAQHT